jgi:hypothetical protein
MAVQSPLSTALLALSAAIVLAGFLSGGIYSGTTTPNGAYIVNRFTGGAWACMGAKCWVVERD